MDLGIVCKFRIDFWDFYLLLWQRTLDQSLRMKMECVMNKHKEIQKMERYAKDKLTFMELASIKK